MKLARFLTVLLLPFACFSADYVTTNLNDRLRTEVTYDPATNISIRLIEIRSIDIDLTMLNTIKLTWRSPKKLSVNDVDVNQLKVMPVEIGCLALDKVEVDDLDLDKVEVDSIAPGKVEVDYLIPEKVAIEYLTPEKLPVEYLQPGKIVVEYLSPNRLLTDYLSLNTLILDNLALDKVDVQDAHSAKLLVVDNSRFKVFWSADTYAELEQMKKAYQFGETYGGSGSPRMKDLEQLYGFSNLGMYYKWLNILWDNKTLDIVKIKPTGSFKLIGEAWIYSNRWDQATKDLFERNLQWTKDNGYNAVFVRFDCTERMQDILELIQMIKNKNMKVFSTYVGQDNTCPRWNPYIDPDKLEPFFKAVAAKSDGYILGWRETSTHVRLMPNEYFNYLCKLAREANPNILLYGEVYFGYTSSSAGRRALYYNIPNNVSGVVVQNMGFAGYNYGYIVQQLFKNIVPDYKSYDKIFQVIGNGPYYRTKNGHNGTYLESLSIEDEYKSKHDIENAFRRYGAKTLTLLHDGVDDNFTFVVADPNDMKHWNDTTDNLLYDTTLTK